MLIVRASELLESSDVPVRRSTKIFILLSVLGALWQLPAYAGRSAAFIPPPAVDAPTQGDAGLQTVILAGGCFWGVQAVFQHTKGVIQAVSGYAGGSQETARYEIVVSGQTGHAQAVQVMFDPRQISYGKLLQIYFSVAHDPTQLNRQGPDVGKHYRSAIFFLDATQKDVAAAYIAQLAKARAFSKPIVTQLNQFTAFYPAEAHHQDFATKFPTNRYIIHNDLPKVENLRRFFTDLYRDKPVLVMTKDRSP